MAELLLKTIPPALVWAAVFWRAPSVRRSPLQRWLWLALLALAVASTLTVTQVYFAIDRAAGVANLAHLLRHGFVIMTSAATREFVELLTRPADEAARGKRWRLLAAATTLVVVTVTFVGAPVGEESSALLADYAGNPWVAGYELAYLLYLGYVLAGTTALCMRYSRHARHRASGTSLRLVGSGTAVGLVFVANQSAVLVAGITGKGGPVTAETTFSTVLVSVSIVLIVAGCLYPLLAVHLQAPRQALASYRSLRRLRPLWADLCTVAPEIAPGHGVSSREAPLTPRHVGLRLYRRVIEIRDGQLALRPYVSDDAACRADHLARQEGLDDEQLEATVAACRLVAARRARQRGDSPVPTMRTVAPGGDDLDSEVSWLEKVAYAYQHSPTVGRFADTIDREHSTCPTP